MLTKFILHIDDKEYELRGDDLRNWDEIRCSYKRADYDGVVRSLSSQFRFVNRAKDLLMEAYLKNRYNTRASVSICPISNRWIYEEAFRCPLDFSTISWDNCTLSINCVDNSLAAIIKSNKSTKYEFTVGEDITRDALFKFDRIPMRESVTYKFTQGIQFEDSADLSVTFEKDSLPFVGNIGSEVSVNKVLFWNDDQDTDTSGFLLRAEKDVDVEMEYDLEWSTFNNAEETVQLYLNVRRNGTILSSNNLTEGKGGFFIAIGKEKAEEEILAHPNPGELPSPDTVPDKDAAFAVIDGLVWEIETNGPGYGWKNTLKTKDEYFRMRGTGKIPLHLQAGDIVYMSHNLNPPSKQSIFIRFKNSRFTFNWLGRGDSVNIDVFTPQKIAAAILNKVADGKMNVDVTISDFDPRLAGTYLLAAESARGITGAKFYSSFAEFCDWISTVFGYVYYIDNQQEENNSGESSTVHFVHRSEILNTEAEVHAISHSRGLKYTVDTSRIYSSVTAGYDKKDYEGINGRDEFNFNNTYMTGCTVTNNTLSLLSKYRADCYGIEFAAQKRAESTTDTTSDKDVFFVLCSEAGGELVPDRTLEIQNSLTGAVFNGAFSPMACVRANAGLIGFQADEITLAFASSTGNSSIMINGESMSSDITVNSPLATCGTIEFTTDDVDDVGNIDELIEVKDNGIIYRGYLKELDIKYARTEAAKYKLIVKDIEP